MFSSFAIAPKHKLYDAWKGGQINSTYSINTKPIELVSSGPFVMSEYAPGQRIVYKPNPNFWKHDASGNQLPYLDTFTYLITPDLNTMVLKFRSGDGDAISMPTNQYPDLKKGEAAGGYTVVDRGPSWGFNYIGFNLNPEVQNRQNNCETLSGCALPSGRLVCGQSSAHLRRRVSGPCQAPLRAGHACRCPVVRPEYAPVSL